MYDLDGLIGFSVTVLYLSDGVLDLCVRHSEWLELYYLQWMYEWVNESALKQETIPSFEIGRQIITCKCGTWWRNAI